MAGLSLSRLRLIVFATSSVFALIVLGLSGNISANSTYNLYDGFSYVQFSLYWPSVPLGIATSVLTLLTLPAALAMERMSPAIDAVTSMVWVELSWLFLLWVLWLATAGYAATISELYVSSITCNSSLSSYGTICGELQATVAFGFLTWILIIGYYITVLAHAINAAHLGEPAWKISAKELTWISGSSRTEKSASSATSGSGGPGTYPPTKPYGQEGSTEMHPTAQYASV